MAQKRNSRKKKTNLKKGKVHIPAIKIILLCGVIIAVCMGLLLITSGISLNEKKTENNVSDENKIEIPVNSVTSRFEEENHNKTTEPAKEKEIVPVKTEGKTVPSKNTETPVKKENEKTASTAKTENTVKAEDIKPPVKNPASEKAPEVKIQEVKKVEPEQSVKVPVQEKKSENATAKNNIPSTKAEKNSENSAAKTEEKATGVNKTDVQQSSVKTPVEPVVKAASSYNFPEAQNGAQLVFLFDDGGQNLGQLASFLKLPFPITIAVLPRLTHSVEAARQIRNSGKELMLHQPMQAINKSVNPGPGAITPDMSSDEIRSTLFYNINEIGPVAGLNNHEGSAITADAEKMETILKVAEAEGVFFLDSRTNKDTQVPFVCHELGYSYFERNGNFLDNEKTKENALKELRKNLDIANKNGVVIMIGHIWSADFLPEFLMEVYPELKNKGYTFTTVSKCKGRKY